jgi:hypothetical protein
MVRFSVITVILLDGTTLVYKDVSLLEVAKECLQHPLANRDPLLLKISQEYNLYFNNTIFVSWIKKEIDIAELIEELKVDQLVRNIVSMQVQELKIEENQLWLVKENLCVLADNDRFLAIKLDNRFKLAF